MNSKNLKQPILCSASRFQVPFWHAIVQTTATTSWGVLLVVVGILSVSAPSTAQTSAANASGTNTTGTANPQRPATVDLQLNSQQQSDEQYMLGDGDLLRIDVFSAPDYSGEYKILNDGSITMPLIGTVSVRGATLSQITAELSQKYGRYFRVPNVTVRLLDARPIRIAISGEVNRPGVYVPNPTQTPVSTPTISAPASPPGGSTSGSTFGSAPPAPSPPATSSAELPTVTSIIQLAGGITQSADVRNIRVYRKTSSGEEKVLQANLWQLLQNSDLSQDIPIQAGDRIVVPTATALSPTDATALSSTTFSPTVITVNVVGEVQKPGPVQVPPNTPLTQVLLAAGGFNTRAKRSAIDFIRLNPNGTITQRTIPVDLSQQISDDKNPPLRNNDTILVRRSGVATFGDNVNPVLTPLTGILSIFRIFGL
jgi:polysaccharide export outer membrane protein